jgi:hypothetical protein
LDFEAPYLSYGDSLGSWKKTSFGTCVPPRCLREGKNMKHKLLFSSLPLLTLFLVLAPGAESFPTQKHGAFDTLFAPAIPIWPAGRAWQQQAEGTSTEVGPANPVPLINQPLVPDAAQPGGAEFQLTVNGTGFASGSVVQWNGSARTTTFVTSSQLTAAVPASDIAQMGTASVTVVNPSPGDGTSNAVFFEVTIPGSLVSLGISTLGTGSQPQSVATGDFNGDGKLDLVEADYGSNTVSVLLGNGDGTFRPRATYATGRSPIAVSVGDFNGDGKLDLAVSNSVDNTVSILLGKGDGTFQPHVDFGTAVGPSWSAVGDFNGDGKLDLAVACNDTMSVYVVCVLLGNGDGTFQAHVCYPTGSWPSWVAVGDFNRDGKLDLAVANAHGDTVSVLLGKGDGTFLAKVDYPTGTGSNPRSIAAGDFNADGKLDLAVASQFNNAISVLLGNGDGTFRPYIDYGTGTDPVWVSLGDFNGDNKLDLAVANFNDGTVNVLLGNGDGTFQLKSDYAPGGNPDAVAVGDFDGSGRLDLAVTNSQQNAVSLLLQITTVSLSQTNLSFADQLVGTSSPSQTVTLTNTGDLTLKISSVTITGADPNDFSQTNTCDSSVPPLGSCTITVIFAPIHIGPRTASVTITDNGVGSPQQIALSGTGVVSGPNATLSPTSLIFALQLVGTTSPPQVVTLSNYGTATLNISSITIAGTGLGDFAQTNTCGNSLPPGANCMISVTFKPTQRGTRTSNLSVADNAPGSPQTVSLSGTGTVVELNPPNLNFGVVNVGQNKSLATMLTNVGNTTLTINSIIITGTDSDEFTQTNTCDGSVGPGKSCTITVTFKPTEVGGDSAAVTISDNGGGSPQQVPLSGTGGQRWVGVCSFLHRCPQGCRCLFGHCASASSLEGLLLDPKGGLLLDSDLEPFLGCEK